MTECLDRAMHERLPLLGRDALSRPEEAVLRAHLATCAACTIEFAVIERARRLFDSATPSVSTAAILAKLPAAPRPRHALTVSRHTRRQGGMPRYALAAAASLLLVASLSLPAVRQGFFGGKAGMASRVDTAEAGVETSPMGLVAGSELGELGSAELEKLLAEIDHWDATVAAEPVSLHQPVDVISEGL